MAHQDIVGSGGGDELGKVEDRHRQEARARERLWRPGVSHGQLPRGTWQSLRYCVFFVPEPHYVWKLVDKAIFPLFLPIIHS